MSIGSNSKGTLITRIVAETCVVTYKEAKERAEGLVTLAEGWATGRQSRVGKKLSAIILAVA